MPKAARSAASLVPLPLSGEGALMDIKLITCPVCGRQFEAEVTIPSHRVTCECGQFGIQIRCDVATQCPASKRLDELVAEYERKRRRKDVWGDIAGDIIIDELA